MTKLHWYKNPNYDGKVVIGQISFNLEMAFNFICKDDKLLLCLIIRYPLINLDCDIMQGVGSVCYNKY